MKQYKTPIILIASPSIFHPIYHRMLTIRIDKMVIHRLHLANRI